MQVPLACRLPLLLGALGLMSLSKHTWNSLFSFRSHPAKRAAVKAAVFRGYVKGNCVVVLLNDWSSEKLDRKRKRT